MAKANRQISYSGSSDPAGMYLIPATLLILLGLAFQAAEMGFGKLWPNNIWLFSVIVPGLWNMLAVQWNAPVWREALKFWPSALVVSGMAMLLVQARALARRASSKAGVGGNHDE